MKNKYIVFDCDGTLVNTYPLIMETFRRTFKKFLPDYILEEDELNSFFGPSLRKTILKYFKEEQVDEVIKGYREINRSLMPTWIYAFEGIVDVLKYLKQHDYPVSILSNKAYDMIMLGLELTNLEEYFDVIIGYEQMPEHKPDPSGIDVIKTFYHTNDLNNIYLIGDTLIDIKTAQNAGIHSVGVTWCITKRETFESANTEYIIDHPSELIKILEE